MCRQFVIKQRQIVAYKLDRKIELAFPLSFPIYATYLIEYILAVILQCGKNVLY